MRILYRYNRCSLSLNTQVIKTEDPTIINADYCTAPSDNNVYLNLGIMHHPTYTPYYELNGADRVVKTFATYPELVTPFYRLMRFTPYRSVWVDSDCDGVKDALSSGASVTIGKSIQFTEDATVVVGIFGDNQFKIHYDGELLMHAPKIGTGQLDFQYLHLFEVDVTAGIHYFTFSGIGDGSVNDALGVIVYDNDVQDLLDGIPKAEWNVLYSSEESLYESIDIVTCPDGYSYDNDSNLCVKVTDDLDDIGVGDDIVFTPVFSCVNTGNLQSYIMDYDDGNNDSNTGAYPDSFIYDYTAGGTYTPSFELLANNRTFFDSLELSIIAPCYGLLYNFHAVDDSRNITSSSNWSVASATQYESLATYLGGLLVAGGKLKKTGTVTWNSPNVDATDEVGFGLKGGGMRDYITGLFSSLKIVGTLWTSTSASDTMAVSRECGHNSAVFGYGNHDKNRGSYVILVEDAVGVADGEAGTYTGNDGKVYDTIVINELRWTVTIEETLYRTGDIIPNISEDSDWLLVSTSARCVFDNDVANACHPVIPSIPLATYDLDGDGYTSFQIDEWLIAQNAIGLESQLLIITGNDAPTELSLVAREALALRYVIIEQDAVAPPSIPLDVYDLTDDGYSAFQIDEWLIAQNDANLSSKLLIITGNEAPTDVSKIAREELATRFVVIER